MVDKQNLVVAWASNTTIDVNADWLCIGLCSSVSGLDLTIDMAQVGANGRDAGSASANWWAVWVIVNKETLAVAGLLSLSGTDPTVPDGYTCKRRVGWVYYTGSAFYRFWHMGTRWEFNEAHNALPFRFINGGTGAAWTEATPIAPPGAEAALFMAVPYSVAAGVCYMVVRPAGSNWPNVPGSVAARGRFYATAGGQYGEADVCMKLVSGKIEYGVTNATAYADSYGWTDPET